MNKLFLGVFFLLVPLVCFSQSNKVFSDNGFSVNSVISSRILETAGNGGFYYVTYLPQITINLRKEILVQPSNESTPISFEPETGIVFTPIHYSDGDQYSGPEYQERINNLSLFAGTFIGYTGSRISFGYNIKANITFLESKKVYSFSGNDREWVKSNSPSTLSNLRFEHGFRLQFRGQNLRWGIYQYRTIGNWLGNRNSYYGNSFDGFSIGLSIGVPL